MSGSSSTFLVAFVLAASAGTGVFFHAERHRIPRPSLWASFTFLALIVGLPAYVLYVARLRRRRGR